MFTIDDLRIWAQHGYLPNFVAPRLAVIGDPVGHSLSPELHQPTLDAAERNMRYARIHVPTGAVAECFQLMAKLNFVGTNVTIPHKLEALEAIAAANPDGLTPHAKLIGAVNTVSFTAEGPRGANTDGPGLLAALEDSFGLDLALLREQKILILGAGGGAGRSAAIQFALSGCSWLALANRTRSKVDKLAKDLNKSMTAENLPLPNVLTSTLGSEQFAVLAAEATIIVNATHLGREREDPLPIDVALLRGDQYVMDMVYTQGGTALINAAQAAGAQAADGLSLLLHQGILSEKIWFDEEPDTEAMKAGLCAATGMSL